MSSLAPAETMPCWYYDKKDIRGNTPSIRDGVDPEMEIRFRKEGARFITNTGNKMGLRHYETLATGIVYFHRFYMIHSFKQFPHYVTACCCLFLAGKVEETPKKCKDIIKAARSLLNDQQFTQFGQDPQEEVMTLERILLQTMKFDLQVDHPYKYLLRYAKCLKGDKQKLENMVQMAWTFVNDSLLTTLCLQWEPEIIAIALIYLATKLKFEVLDWNGRLPKHQGWWDMYVEDITIELLEDVCHQVLDLYSNNAKSESPTPTTPPHPPKPGQVKLTDLNSSQLKKSKTTSPMTPVGPHPPKTPVDTPKMEPMVLDPNVQMQGPIIAAPSEPPVHMNVMHGYNYVTSMPGMPEGFAPTQYIPSPNNPYANFGEMGLQGQSVVERPYPPGFYEVGGYPPRFPPGAPPPMSQYSAAVPVHYNIMTEPPGFTGGRPPNQPGQFPAGVLFPGAYPAPGFGTSPVPTRPVHQGLMRGGGVARLPNRHPSHPNWGV